MSEAGDTIKVGQGVVSDTDDGIGFGGRNAVPARDGESAKVRIAVWDAESTEFSIYLHERETFEIAGQTWRLDGIHDEGPAPARCAPAPLPPRPVGATPPLPDVPGMIASFRRDCGN